IQTERPMKLMDMDLLDECFTHVDDATGVQTTYNVTKLYEHIVAHEDLVERVLLPVEEGHARFCITNRGVEQDRLKVLVANPTYLSKPIMLVNMPDGTQLLVDGTHRYVVAFACGAKQIPAYMIPADVVQPFIIEDAPQCD